MYIDKEQICLDMAVKSRKILISGEINEDTFVQFYYLVNKIVDRDRVLNNGRKPITVVINSCGGEVTGGLSIISAMDWLRSLKYKVNTFVIGDASSMAFVIAVTGDKRTCSKYAKYLYHDMSYWFEGSYYESTHYLDAIEDSRKDIKDILTKYTKFTEHQLEGMNMRNIDTTFNAEEAKNAGLVDIIYKGVAMENKEGKNDMAQKGYSDIQYIKGQVLGLVDAGVPIGEAFEGVINLEINKIMAKNNIEVAKITELY